MEDTYSIGDTFCAVLGKKKTAAPTAPAAMAMLRGVKVGMLAAAAGLDVNFDWSYGR